MACDKPCNINISSDIEPVDFSVTQGPDTILGGNTYIIDDGVNPPVTICDGVNNVRVDNSCASPGIGNRKVIKSILINGKNLVIDAVNDHTTVCGEQNAMSLSLPTNTPLVNGSTVTSQTEPLCFINTTCRTVCMRVDKTGHQGVFSRAGVGLGQVRFALDCSVNGGPWTLAATESFATNTNPTQGASAINQENRLTWCDNFTIAPGGVFCFRARTRLVNNNVAANSFLYFANSSLKFFGSTI